MRVLIVDDEPLIRRGIRRALEAASDVDVAGECGTGDEAIDAIRAQTPDLVLLDVHMLGCSGLEVVRRVGPDRMPAVVFVTAFDEYAVDAFEMNAVDYLLKPFDPERVCRAVERARRRLTLERDGALAARLQALLDGRDERPDHLVVRSGERYELVPFDTIDWVEAADNYVRLHCGSKSHLLADTLTNIERKLDGRHFLRIHRSRIVNAGRIVAAYVVLGGAYELELRGGLRLTTGRQYRHVVQQFLRG